MKHLSEDHFPYRYLIYFLTVTIIISVIGYLFFLDRKKTIEDELYRHVVAIKEIKLQQIEKEQLQRKLIIQAFFQLPEIAQDVQNLVDGRSTSQMINKVSGWAQELKNDFDFISVNIFDTNANVIFSTNENKNISRGFLKHELEIILKRDSSSLTNLYLGTDKNLIQGIITPVKKSNRVIGFIWTEISFFEYLQPIIAYTKQESEDVEFILLKNKSDLGFILKEGRTHVNNLQTLPLDKKSKDELDKYLLDKNINRNVEINGSKIIASVNNLPGTDWLLIAKINQEKVTESTKNTSIVILIISLLLIGLSASVTYAIWNKSRIHFITRTINLRKEKEALSERYTSLTRYANDMILSLDKHGNILEANQKAYDTYGYNKNEFLKMNLLDLSYNRKKDVELIFSSVNTEQGILFETNHKRKNGTVIPVEISAKLIKQGDEEILLAIIRDNTERKKLELDLILAKDKAEEMDRLKTIFLSNMSHELNTPMSGIIGFSELLLAELEDKNHKDMAAFIHKSSRRLNDTLTSLLDISKLESQKMNIKTDKIELITILKECKSNFDELATAKGLIINFISSKDKIYVKGEYSILNKIFSNLLDNAVKYTKHGEINIIAEINRDNAVVKISDTGIGISEEHLDMIFEPFRQASEGLIRKYEGTGLGLSLTKKFVDILNGSLEVQSEVNVGTTISVYLPLSPK
jgi:PAS domain S-box-containing protein